MSSIYSLIDSIDSFIATKLVIETKPQIDKCLLNERNDCNIECFNFIYYKVIFNWMFIFICVIYTIISSIL